jgi:hypothetical protein
MTCPIPFETLVAWIAGDLPESVGASVEEHIFSCDSCAAASERTARLAGGLRETIPWVISRRQYDRLVGGGTRILVTPVEPGRTPRARFTPEVDLLVHALRGDFSRAERIDVDIFSPDRTKHVLLEHVPFDRASGEVLVACQRHYEGLFDGDPIFEVYTIERTHRKPIGEYDVQHVWRRPATRHGRAWSQPAPGTRLLVRAPPQLDASLREVRSHRSSVLSVSVRIAYIPARKSIIGDRRSPRYPCR